MKALISKMLKKYKWMVKWSLILSFINKMGIIICLLGLRHYMEGLVFKVNVYNVTGNFHIGITDLMEILLS